MLVITDGGGVQVILDDADLNELREMGVTESDVRASPLSGVEWTSRLNERIHERLDRRDGAVRLLEVVEGLAALLICKDGQQDICQAAFGGMCPVEFS